VHARYARQAARARRDGVGAPPRARACQWLATYWYCTLTTLMGGQWLARIVAAAVFATAIAAGAADGVQTVPCAHSDEFSLEHCTARDVQFSARTLCVCNAGFWGHCSRWWPSWTTLSLEF
jgi:hypothetical protein